MTKRYALDTNLFLRNPNIVDSLDGYSLSVPSVILRELEKFENEKYKYGEEFAYQARCIRRGLKKLNGEQKIYIDLKDYVWDLNTDYSSNYMDNCILKYCLVTGDGLITYDGLLYEKAISLGIEVVNLEENDKFESTKDYTGIHKIFLTESDENQKALANLYEHPELNTYNLLTNQYLIVYDKNKPIYDEFGKVIRYKVIDKFRFNGEKLVKLKLPDKKTVKAKNEEQECALDMLYNNEIPIKIIAGTYGSGKTFLTVKSALHSVLEKGNQAKIMVLRNPIGSGEAIGWLKGSKEDKTQDFFKPFVQHLEGGEQEAALLETRGQLIKEIPYYIKGLSIDDTFVVVDEAEDLDDKLLKLIGTRLGVNSVITFAGDFKQAEDKYKGRNGLLHAVDKLKGKPLVGIVILEEDVRSEASKVFAEM
jgi:PhoH-like ATPase